MLKDLKNVYGETKENIKKKPNGVKIIFKLLLNIQYLK